MSDREDLIIKKGKTFSLVVRWESLPIIYKAITGIANTAPIRLTVPGHGFPDGWRVAATNVKGTSEINAVANEVEDADYHPLTVIDANTIEFNDVNAAGFSPYISGGYIQGFTPVDLTNYTARASIKDRVGGTVLLSLTTENDRIAIDATKHTIELNITEADTILLAEALGKKVGVYDLELVSPDSPAVVTELLAGKIYTPTEVTT